MRIKAESRTIIGKKSKQIRATLIPAVIYGPSHESTNIQIDKKEFSLLYKNVGQSKLFTIDLNGVANKVIVKEIDIHPVRRDFVHVAFYAVDMNKNIDANVPVELIGISPAVKNNLGFLEFTANSLEVRCLPANLPSVIKVDISNLENIGDAITVADLKLDKKIHVLGDNDGTSKIVFIAAPQKMEEVEEVKEEEVVEEEKAV